MDACYYRHHKFEILDNVFQEFLNTNVRQGKTWTLDEMLCDVREKNFYFHYEHDSIPYFATVFLYEAPDANWLNIKLVNNGFVYQPRLGEPISRHELQGLLDGKVEYAGGRRVVFYNHQHNRLDIKIWKRTDDPSDASTSTSTTSLPHLMITYEPGYPDEEYNY
ncbi:hypothetical protein QOT17_016859 [Balamuthia mandrillaris]